MGPEPQIDAMKPQGPRLKGFGYLYRRGTIWWIRYSVRGRDFRESSHSEHEGVAQKLLKARWQELGRGRFVGPSQERVTMEDLFTSLETEYEINARRSLSTLKGRLVHLRLAFGNCRAIDVNEEKLEHYKQTRLAERTTRGRKPIQPATTGWRRGEISSLQWSAVNRQARTIFLGRSKNGETRILPLVGEIESLIERRWQARSVENKNGSTALTTYVFHCGDGRPIGDTRKSWRTACSKAGLPNLLVHDLRRSAVRNFDKNGVTQVVGMMISGHKTASVYKRYRIVPENDIREALQKVEQAINEQKKVRSVTTMTGSGTK